MRPADGGNDVQSLSRPERNAVNAIEEPRVKEIDSPYLTGRQAAAYLNIAYGTFRNYATRIRRTRFGRYRREDLDKFAMQKR